MSKPFPECLLALVLLFVASLWLVEPSRAQEDEVLPSQKMKEAVGKLKSAPAAVGKAMENLKEQGKAKILEMLPTSAPAKAQGDSFALPERKSAQPEGPPYSALGKRDPFLPPSPKPQGGPRQDENLPPIQRYELDQFKLVGIAGGNGDWKALVIDPEGKSYTITVGMAVGPTGTQVKAIRAGEVVFEEKFADKRGLTKVREVVKRLSPNQ